MTAGARAAARRPVSLSSVRAADGGPRNGAAGSRGQQQTPPRGREAQYLRRADALAASGQVEKALAHHRKLVTALPESTHGYLRIASLLRQAKRAGEALEVLRAVARAPRCLAPREALAETCLESGRWEEAIGESRILLSLSPHSLFARDVLSAAYLQRGLLDAALRITDEMIRLDPTDATNHFKRGVLLQQKGRIGAAIQSFCRVLEMAPDPEVAEESRAALEMLDGYQIRQILTIAVEDVPFRLNLQRDAGEAIAEKGYLLSDAGLQALSQVCFDDLPDAPPGWRHFRYH
jgi:tetratricopeptide (TPR) repeat protein